MVAIKHLLTGAIILGGAAAFVSLGGAKGIGSRIGGGLGSFGSALGQGFSTGIGSLGKDSSEAAGPTVREDGPQVFDPLDSINKSLNKLFTGKTNAFEGRVVQGRNGSTLTINPQRFAPVGGASVLGIRGHVLPDNAIARSRETFTGTLTTAAGGTRDIAGSKGLFERLERNLNG